MFAWARKKADKWGTLHSAGAQLDEPGILYGPDTTSGEEMFSVRNSNNKGKRGGAPSEATRARYQKKAETRLVTSPGLCIPPYHSMHRGVNVHFVSDTGGLEFRRLLREEAAAACGNGMFSLESDSHLLCFHVRCTPVSRPKKVSNAQADAQLSYKPFCESCDSYFGDDGAAASAEGAGACWADEALKDPSEWTNMARGSSLRRQKTMLAFEQGSEMQLWSVPHADGTGGAESLAGWEATSAEDGDPVVFTVRVVSLTLANSYIHGIMWCNA